MSIYMAYCKDVAHASSVVIAAGTESCVIDNDHETHTSIGILEKPVDLETLIGTHGAGLFAHLETTYGSEMT